MQIRPARPLASVASRPAANGPAPAQPPRPPAPARPIKAQGAPDTTSKVVGAVIGTASGVAGAYSLAMLLSIGSASIPVLGWAALALCVATGAGLGWLGGDRVGDWLEGTKAAGKPHRIAQAAGGVVGGALGLGGGFWLGFWGLGAVVGTPAIGFATAAIAAALGAVGGAEGAKRLVDYLAKA